MKKFVKAIAAFAVAFVAVLSLAACVPANAEKAKAKLEDAGYAVIASENGFVATKLEGFKVVGTVTAAYFDSKDDAKKFYEELDGKNTANLKRSGKCVYYGDEQGIKDFN